jgi:hypothetical protein
MSSEGFWSRMWKGTKRGKAPSPAGNSGGGGTPALSDDEWAQRLPWVAANDPRNPFRVEVLDCRAMASTMMCWTTERSIAESFNALRRSDGRQFIDQLPANPLEGAANISFPYNGQHNDGPITRGQQMEDKWDYTIYGDRAYLTSSWTGEVLHVLVCEFGATAVRIPKIISNSAYVLNDPEFAIAEVQFLLLTLLGKMVLPFPVAPDVPRIPARVGLNGFSRYGRAAQFATFEWPTFLTALERTAPST